MQLNRRSWLWVQLKAWEEYTLKLEEKYVALMTEHESFQRELASVRGILDDGTDPEIHGQHCALLCIMSIGSGRSIYSAQGRGITAKAHHMSLKCHMTSLEVQTLQNIISHTGTSFWT